MSNESAKKNVLSGAISVVLFLLAFGLWMLLNKSVKQFKEGNLELKNLETARTLSGAIWFIPVLLGLLGWLLLAGKIYKSSAPKRSRRETFVCESD